jgi:prepilin-type N-terminal cleavage/methylation domain-containing protein
VGREQSGSGFTLIELMIVVGVIAIVSGLAIPRIVGARMSANENAAIATLRSIAAAQQQVNSSSSVDTDGDGGGEYCYIGELAGTAPVRALDLATLVPVIGATRLVPTHMPTPFGDIQADVAGHGCVERQGYLYKIFLPDANVDAALPTGGYAEAAAGGTDPARLAAWGSGNCEVMWCVYAWPVRPGQTGTRAFFLNQEGDIIAHDNKGGAYTGLLSTPAFDAALSDVVPGDFDQPLGLATLGNTANDGNLWVLVGN